ncbi:MAG: hypothetical protein QXJ17_01775 [Nitrososphaeria archaeon]
MTVVKFDKIKDRISDFQAFVKEKKGIEGKVDGNSIEYPEINVETLKLLVKKYLHKQRLEDYRVLSQSGVLTIAEKEYFETKS